MLGGYAASEMLPPRNAVEEDGQRILRKKKSQNGRRTQKSAVKNPTDGTEKEQQLLFKKVKILAEN